MQKVENSKREREASDSAGHGIKDPEEAEGKRRKVGTGESTPPLVPTAASTPSIAESAAGAPDQQPNPAVSSLLCICACCDFTACDKALSDGRVLQ